MKIAVVGAGLTGLTAAYKLSQQGHGIVIYEESKTPGGLASAFKAGSENLDRFYHHMFVSDSDLLDLMDELSLHNALNWYEPKNAIYLEDSLFPFTSPFDLLRFTPLRFSSRVRTGLLVLRSGFIKDYRPLESVRAKDWIINRSGQEAYDKIWGPLLKSKFDMDSDLVSGTWIWNKFKLRGSSRGKNIAKEQLGYLDGGFILLIERLIEKIRQNDGNLLLENSVKSMAKSQDGRWEISSEKGRSLFDKVLFTAAPEILANSCSGLSQEYRAALRSIKYKANLCLALELKESLSPYYWITVAQEGFPFVLVIEHTNLVGLRGYGSHIIYLSRYLDASDPLFSASDSEIEEKFTDGLKRIFPDFEADYIKKATVSRVRYAQPVVKIGCSENIPDIETPLDGLFLASMPQIYPEDRGLNYAVRLGRQAADRLIRR